MVWLLWFTPAYLLVGGYAVTRALEHLTVMRLANATATELCDLSLARLYRWTTRLERRRLRYERMKEDRVVARGARAVLDTVLINRMRVLGHRRDRVAIGERLAMTLNIAFRMIDEVVDDPRSADHLSRERFVSHIDTLLSHWGERQWLQDPATRVDPALIYTLSAGSLAEVDTVHQLRAVWADYLPDVQRHLDGVPVADRATIQRVHHAYVLLEQLSAMLLGLDARRALLFAELDAPARTAKDDLWDLLSDIRTGLLPCCREELDERGIDLAQLLSCRTFEDVARVRGVAHWCVDRAERHRQTWQEALPVLRREVVPYIRARWDVWLHTQEFEARLATLERIAQTWRQHLNDAVQPAGEPAASGTLAPVYHRFDGDNALESDTYAVLGEAPAAWQAGAEFLAACAERFGIPVSAHTREAWYRWCCAAAILDRLLDDSPDPEQAFAVFRLLVGTEPDAALPAVPIWVRTSEINAGAIIRATLPSFPWDEQVRQLSLDLGAFALMKRREHNVRAYVRTLTEEARVNGLLVAACTFEDERMHPAYPRFRRFCARLFIFGVALDNNADLRGDYRNATAAIPPTIVNRFVFVANLVRTGVELAAANPGQMLGLVKAFCQYRWRAR